MPWENGYSARRERGHELETSTPPAHPHRDIFGMFAAWTTRATGGRWGFIVAFASVAIWAVTGPLFKFSSDWQLVINTGTTIVTFLMVFLIQNSQNRESKAIHLKLDELIHAVRAADNQMINIESLTEEQLDRLAARYEQIARPLHEQLSAKIHQVEEEVREVSDQVEDVRGRERPAPTG